jgi:hypothetical protein
MMPGLLEFVDESPILGLLKSFAFFGLSEEFKEAYIIRILQF